MTVGLRLLAATLAIGAATAHAATFTVTNLNDSGAGSLRDAIGQANGAPGADTINFAVTGTIVLTSGSLFIAGPVTITGPGAASLTIDGNASERVFIINDFSGAACPAPTAPVDYLVTISGLTLANARQNQNFTGGAIHTVHSLALSNVVIRDSIAKAGGGVSFLVQHPGQSLTIANSQFLNNLAKPLSSPATGTIGGGAVRIGESCATRTQPVTVSISNTLFSGNRAQPINQGGRGGAILSFSDADITIADSRFEDNSVDVSIPPAPGVIYQGGAIYGRARSLTLLRSEIAGSRADIGSAMGFFNDLADLQTPQLAMSVDIVNSTISNNAASGTRAVNVFANVAISVTNSTITGNSAPANRSAGFGFNTGATAPPTAQNAIGGSLEITSSILWNRGASNLDITKDGNSLGPMTVSATDSMIGVICGSACGAPITLAGTGNQVGVDPFVGPLAFNGGPTRTRALLFPSPAINRGSNPLGLATDQRGSGFPRVVGSAADIGAFEYVPPAQCESFSDVSGPDPFCASVAWLKNRGITTGCLASQYCPTNDVSRLAMAAFMNRLGTALTLVPLAMQQGSGAQNIDTDPIVCATSDYPVTGFPRRAYVDGVLSAFATSDVGLLVNPAISFDGGSTWQDLLTNPNRAHVRANRWHNLHELAHVDLNAGQSVRFGLHIDRGGLAGGGLLADTHCNLRVRLDNGTGASAP